MGGPDMAPRPPRPSRHPGEAEALLEIATGPSPGPVMAVSPIPRLVRWGIALITAFFVVMMFSPLVQEIVRRVRLSGTVNLP